MAISRSALTAIVASDASAGAADFQVKLRALALDPDAVARSGVVAWEMSLAVDCVHGKVRAGPTEGFADRRASGEGVPLAPADPAWRSPRAGTQLDSIWRATCDPHYARPLTGLAPAAAPPVVAQAAPRTQLALATPAPAPRAAPPETPATRVAAAGAPSAPARAPSPPRLAAAAPAPPPLAHAAAASATATNAVAREPVALAAPRVGPVSHVLVQVISSPDRAETQARLARLGSRFGAAMAQLETRVEPAQVRGRSVYRGMVAGFATRADAAAFCATLKSGGQDCLLR